MGKLEKLKAKIGDEEEEDVKLVIDISSGDEEANEDLSLKIVEKALLMRAVKLAENDNDGVVLVDDKVLQNDSAVGGVRNNGVHGGTGDGTVLENAFSLSLDTEAVVKDSSTVRKRRKKRKIQKTGNGDHSDGIPQEEDKAGTEDKVENAKVDQTTVELDNNLDTNFVQTSDNIVLRKLLRGPRYFDPPDNGWSTCYNCGKEGHMAINCPSVQKKKKPCFLCGSFEHGFKQCSKERVCIVCKSVGHRARKCPEKHNGCLQSSKVCLKCGDYGHDMFSCDNSYALDDLKEIRCYICKSYGHLCCANIVDNSPREVSCYKCGELGHNGLECSGLREEATTASPSTCYRCGERGHFARECTSSEKEFSGLREEATTASPSTCYRCGERGHFARECTSSAKAGKSNNEYSTPTWRPLRENKEITGLKSAPQDSGKSRKRRKMKSKERSLATPKKPKQRGWITEGPEDISQSRRRKNSWRSPSTPSYKSHTNSIFASGGQTSGSQSSKRMHKGYSGTSNPQLYKKMQVGDWGTSALQGSATPFQHRYAASRFSNSGNTGFRGNHNWW